MKVIDNILLEWSYRCPDGIVDLNDPNKAKILFEILKPYLKEDIDDDILNVLTNIDNVNTKEKVLKYLQKLNKKEDKVEDKVEDKIEENIIQKLEAKNLTDSLADLVVLYANKSNDLRALSNYLNNPTVTYSDLLSNDNLSSLFEPIKLSDTFKNKIINLSGAVGNVTLGKGEIALIIFLKDAEKHKSSKESKGDIKVENYVLEVKRGPSILASAGYIKRATKSNLFSSGKPKEFVEKYNIDITERKNWVVQITEANPEKKEIEDILKELYPGLGIDINGINLSIAEELNNAIGLALAKEYLNKKDLLFINEQNEYICVENYDTFEKAVQNKSIKFNIASDIIPRTVYKGQPEPSNNEITEDDDDTI
jgi:DNA replicative helicase MCM subunit Mcm2 (Cdc46/Mcm family)